jgi:hypothetical protein
MVLPHIKQYELHGVTSYKMMCSALVLPHIQQYELQSVTSYTIMCRAS